MITPVFIMQFFDVKAILLDIEGTTTSINFVKEVLFPLVSIHVRDFLKKHWEDSFIQEDILDLVKQSEIDVKDGIKGACLMKQLPKNSSPEQIKKFQESVSSNVLWQMSKDRKTTALKKLQGHMWARFYEDGEILGHVYDDVPSVMQKWRNSSKKIFIYSSGSVEAQKLLFKYSVHGNMMPLIDGYFDTNVGAKTDAASYKKISEAVNVDVECILFITDLLKEALAAKQAGMQVLIMQRDDNPPLSNNEENIPNAKTFLDIKLI